MQLFYVINNWAGRSVWFDEALRFFYVSAVPLLATALAALLIFAPRHPGAAARRRVAWATLLAVSLCLLTLPAINAFARGLLQAEVLSPRPFVTHRVNLLLIEPNDNSFPCAEVLLCATLATLVWAAAPRWGLLGWVWAVLFGFTRVICGSNFAADVIAGWMLGWSWAALSLAVLKAPLHFGLRDGRRCVWQPRFQAAFSSMTLLCVSCAALFSFAQTPRFGPKIKSWFSVARASAATEAIQDVPGTSGTMASHEGEGVPSQIYSESSPANTSQDKHRSDYIPKADTLLRDAWKPLRLPHRLLTVDVAQVRAGTNAYRCATVRFVVEKRGADERRRVLQTATQLAKRAFHADGQLQNIDVVAVVLNPEPEDFAPRPTLVPGPLPVFSASVAARDVRNGRQIPQKLAAANPGVDEKDAQWLRNRSLLYFNERVLPAPHIAALNTP